MIAAWWVVFVVGAFVFAPSSEAGQLTFVSDLITNSVPGESGSHTITFTTVNAIPASGKIVIDFEAGGITNLASLDYLDADIASSSDYTLAATPSGGTLGVAFSGSGLVITLGNTPVAGGTALTIELGTVATYGATGDTLLINGVTLGDYRVSITTKTSADVAIDFNEAVFIIVNPVGLSVGTPTPTVGGGGGGGSSPSPTPLAGVGLWPAEAVNPDVFGARLLDTNPADEAEAVLNAMVTNSGDPTQLGVDGNPIAFVTALGEPAVAVIAAGAWEFTTYAMATDGGGNTSLLAAVYVRAADGTETLLFEHQITSNLASSPTLYSTSTYQPEYTLQPTDHIVLRYFTQTGSSESPVTVTLFYQGEEQYSHVETPPYYTPLPSCFRIADFNGDCRVNITDFSILMANWGSNPRNPATDINEDGSAGIVDLSILLYWWTG